MPCVDLQMGWEVGEGIELVESARVLTFGDMSGDKAEVRHTCGKYHFCRRVLDGKEWLFGGLF